MDKQHMYMSTDPIFPEDVEREIFETMARLHPDEAPFLVRVAKRVHIWVEAVLFKVVMTYQSLRSPPGITVDSFKRNTRHLHHLLIGAVDVPLNREILHSLPLCTEIEDLAVWTDDLKGVIEHCETLRPRRVSMAIVTLFGHPGFGDAHLGFFSRLTHFEVVDVASNWEDFSDVSKIPELTHLSLMVTCSDRVIRGVLRECRKLKILALVQQYYVEGNAPCVHDPVKWEEEDDRVVSFLCDFEADWEAFARGGDCMWTMAEGIVANRIKERQPSQ
ncbi:hypothetical protein BDN72DRAFT_880010 [Pluteus cervinus]|uniref:Uncharacterized protein n=1 Tax=Pluteus cervinus TaxID=181527 RepID=A0ACD3AN10_9AGAR|nr:hypothetical protein BDN72DRAFT_880010 [Pluteus cervinus]